MNKIDIFKKSFISRKSSLWLILVLGLSLNSCEDTFLDVVPDNVNTIDKVFNLRNEAVKYLNTCYSYMPDNGSLTGNPAFLAGDEMWIPDEFQSITAYSLNVALGLQNVTEPYFNPWDGRTQSVSIWRGIRHCNIFLDNLADPTQVPDLLPSERERWVAEAKFLKAYYHFYLMRMYGAVPLVKTNVSVDATADEYLLPRAPFDETVDYIVQLLDEAAAVLPPSVPDINTQYGRITSTIAKAVKAKILLTAASPLFNGNGDLSDMVNPDGTVLYSSNYSPEKWQRAADATLDAIQTAESAGHVIYEYDLNTFDLSDTTTTKLSIRNALTLRRSPEVIWPNTQSLANSIQLHCMAPLNIEHNHNDARKIVSIPLDIAKMFYSVNGVPINEDNDLNFNDILELRKAGAKEKFNISEGYTTSRLNFDREPRFYADLAFDGAIWYRNADQDSEAENHVEGKYADYAGGSHAFHFNVTGYYCKKLVNNDQSFNENGASYRTYAWPEIRLADLYLMYAETLNEINGPTTEIFEYIDPIRKRAGLEGVVDSWLKYSLIPDKPTSTKEGLREIIHRERNIELAFEGHRYWDLLRWKKNAVVELNEPIQGWNIFGENESDYYRIRTIHQQRFVAPRDYFWPIREYSLLQNPALIQNPGW